jgi:SNF2 family DNA or RNA helicase
MDAAAKQMLETVNQPQVDIEYALSSALTDQKVPSAISVRLPSHAYGVRTTLRDQLSARWSSKDQAWRLPPYLAYARALEEEFSRSFQKPIYRDGYDEWRNIGLEAKEELRVPDSLKWVWEGHDASCSKEGCSEFHGLYPFQKDAVRYLLENPYDHPGVLLALSPGLGKTVVALTAAAMLDMQRVLIISPLSLLSVWEWEAAKWFGKASPSRLPARFRAVHGESPPDDGWVVTNYNTVTSPRRNSDYWEQTWDAIILDESVLIKNRKSQRFANIKNLRGSTDRVWLLSGSPITKHPNDLWSQFHLIEQRAWPAYWKFTRRWCAVEKNIYGTRILGSSGRDLKKDFEDVLFVKNQEEVLPDLPDMIFTNVNVGLTHPQHRTYDTMLTKFVAILEKAGVELDAPSKLAQLTRLQQIASNVCNLSSSETLGSGHWPDSSSKAEALEEMLQAESLEFPLLVWTHWKPGAEALAIRLEALGLKVGIITGDLSEEERTDVFADYKGSSNADPNAKLDILILQLGVGKFGVNLQKTRSIVYVDRTWSADDYVQSLYRVRRIGLTHVPHVYILHAPNTIDDMVEDNLAGKMVPISEITNSKLANLLKGLSARLKGLAA